MILIVVGLGLIAFVLLCAMACMNSPIVNDSTSTLAAICFYGGFVVLLIDSIWSLIV